MAILGRVCLLLALIASSAVIVLRALGKGKDSYARILLYSLCGFLTLALMVLLIAFLGHNFQIEYVALHSDSGLAWPYLISGIWAGDSGSLLLWAWFTSVFGLTLTRGKDSTYPFAQLILAAVVALLVALLVFASSPFKELSFPVENGIGLNPLLQHPAMIIHPPLVLASYAGFAVAFSLALASIVPRQVHQTTWLHSARQWALASWVLLGAGNLLGAWWAYVELGWGGYWAWDPVENGGLMPWLTATAFLHSASMLERKGTFKVWTLAFAFLTFSLVTVAALITRTGILSSVHTFGESPSSPFLLALVLLVFLGSFILLAFRHKDLGGTAQGSSPKENTILISNFLFLGVTLLILLGTLLPLISQLFTSGSIVADKGFFTTTTVPLFLSLILLAGICFVVPWRRDRSFRAIRAYLWPLVAALGTVVVLLLVGITQWYVLVTAFICAFTLVTIVLQWVRKPKPTPAQASAARPEGTIRRYGVYLIHLAIVLIALGVTGSSVYSSVHIETLAPGSSMTADGYSLTYQGLEPMGSERMMVVEARIDAYQGDKYIATLKPQVQFHPTYGAVSEVAIRSTPTHDLYVVLAGWDETMNATIETRINPLVMWLWIGGGLLLLGGIMSLWPGGHSASTEGKW